MSLFRKKVKKTQHVLAVARKGDESWDSRYDNAEPEPPDDIYEPRTSTQDLRISHHSSRPMPTTSPFAAPPISGRNSDHFAGPTNGSYAPQPHSTPTHGNQYGNGYTYQSPNYNCGYATTPFQQQTSDLASYGQSSTQPYQHVTQVPVSHAPSHGYEIPTGQQYPATQGFGGSHYPGDLQHNSSFHQSHAQPQSQPQPARSFTYPLPNNSHSGAGQSNLHYSDDRFCSIHLLARLDM